MNNCIKCRENREAIRKHKMICGSVDSQTGELNQEFGRHRFTPYSKRELDKMSAEAKKDEEIWRKILAEDTDENWEKWKKENGLENMRA